MEPSLELREILQASPHTSDAVVPVLVLKVGRYFLHHGAVGIIRSLGRMSVPVYGIVENRFTPAAVSKYLSGAFVWDTRGLDVPRFLEGMAVIGERLKRPTILIATDDRAAILIAEQAAALRRWFLFPQQPATLPRTLANKRELYLLCKSIGAACPDAVFPSSLDEVHEYIEHAEFPVVVKAAESWLLPEGVRTTSIARNPEQAYEIYRSTQSQRRPNVIFQEYIDPTVSEDWFYHGYRNVQSDCFIGFTGRKLRSYPPFVGPSTLGKAVINDPLRQQAETLLRTVSYSGIMDLDYRFDKRDGQYKLLDFNPRIGAQFRLFEDSSGVDVARALYLDLAGRCVPSSRPTEGRTFIVEFHDLVASIYYFRQGGLTLREWRLSLAGAREFAWFSRDDPFPCVMMCIGLLFRAVGRVLRMSPTPNIACRMPHFDSGWRNRMAHRTREVRVAFSCWMRKFHGLFSLKSRALPVGSMRVYRERPRSPRGGSGR
jgi:predicted ATP-grasp superfamily ATP-dependent carboligase